MTNPYQPSSSRVESAQERTRGIHPVLLALILFVAGYAVPLFMWYFTLPAPKNCRPPCDGPGYVLIGVLLFIGPVAGLLSAGIGLLVRRIWRRKAMPMMDPPQKRSTPLWRRALISCGVTVIVTLLVFLANVQAHPQPVWPYAIVILPLWLLCIAWVTGTSLRDKVKGNPSLIRVALAAGGITVGMGISFFLATILAVLVSPD